METVTLWIPILLMGGFLVVGYVLRQRRSAVRREVLDGLAGERGWRYFESEPGLVDRWPGKPFGTGDHRSANHVIRGSWRGHKFISFDYSYQVAYPLDTVAPLPGTRPSRRFGVVVMKLPGSLPWLEVQHENLITEAIDRALRSPDIQFESAEFNRMFHVSAPDDTYARAVITPALLRLLLDRGEVAWRIMGGDLLAWDTGSPDGTDLQRRLAFLAAVIDEIPRQVWRDYAGVIPGLPPEPDSQGPVQR